MELIWKEIGETPLTCIERYRKVSGISESTPMTYAGRLDPMAEGILPVLVGEECKQKDQYLDCDKEYEFRILVGFKTDTHDLLGLVQEVSPDDFNSTLLQESLSKFIGIQIQTYPAFSSKPFLGKPLFQHAKDGTLPSSMPKREITIYTLEYLGMSLIEKNILQNEIMHKINSVMGDFRQLEIIDKWEEIFSKTDKKQFQLLSLKMKCSSGTYVRQFVDEMSNFFKIPLVTFSITRTKVFL